ncbi:CLUMA_CG003884, isoform B [Clunio marinus]|uniref:CLUMA_CG003884, isoform B n=1 Tax=Clunio marinus TaxID=568069 RepID=A0A1J1HRL6_9DIPT|nr:CLUMA_CG003884, isoform B [Clunio marinus]
MSKEVNTEDNFLLSSENLRASPELWPEKIPGSDNFAKSAHKLARENEKGLTQEDIRLIYQLGQLPKSGIITEIKRLYDEGYQLGLDEGKEITRGKYLNIFAQGTLSNRKK